MRRIATTILLFLWQLPALGANAPGPLLPVEQKLDTDRFAGTWHVVANIPVRIPFFSDADAIEYTQHVTKTSDTTVTLYTRFLRANHGNKVRDNTYRGFLQDPVSNAKWDFQPIWPIRIGCTIFYLEDDYGIAMIGVPSRNWAWVMAREIPVSAARLNELLQKAAESGFDPKRFRRIPGTYTE